MIRVFRGWAAGILRPRLALAVEQRRSRLGRLLYQVTHARVLRFQVHLQPVFPQASAGGGTNGSNHHAAERLPKPIRECSIPVRLGDITAVEIARVEAPAVRGSRLKAHEFRRTSRGLQPARLRERQPAVESGAAS